MVFAALREAFGLLRTIPVIWLTGLALGVLSALQVVVGAYADAFYTERIWIFETIILPFFIGATYGVIRNRRSDAKAFVQEGISNYFRILLPSLVVLFAALLTVFFVVIGLTLLGVPADTGVITLITGGVMIPFFFFTFFYDTAAVFEDLKVFDAIRRSVEFVLLNSLQTILFFAVALLIFLVIGMVAIILWSFLLAGQLEPLTMMTQEEIALLTPGDLIGMIGEAGIGITALVYMGAVSLFAAILYPFKAAFYLSRTALQPAVQQQQQGEYDEKGRWYRY